MNFFQQQDIARKNTRWLILLFALAVLSLLVITNLFLLLFPWEINSTAFSEQGGNRLLVCLVSEGCNFFAAIDWQQLVIVSTLVLSVILILQLRRVIVFWIEQERIVVLFIIFCDYPLPSYCSGNLVLYALFRVNSLWFRKFSSSHTCKLLTSFFSGIPSYPAHKMTEETQNKSR